MFNTRDPLFGKKDDHAQRDFKSNASPLPRSSFASTPTTTPSPTPTAPVMEPAAPAVATAPGESKGSRLIVGPDIKLKGVEITDCDTLVVEGRVEASMDSRVIQIAEHGVYSGTVGIDVAEIHGRFEGELTARKQLVIHATGKVSGKIRYGKISVEEGGEVSGDVHTLSGTSAEIAEKSGSRVQSGPYDALAAKNKIADKNAGIIPH
jgi:cytoskeletal protein CcmA (bactofilin family)